MEQEEGQEEGGQVWGWSECGESIWKPPGPCPLTFSACSLHALLNCGQIKGKGWVSVGQRWWQPWVGELRDGKRRACGDVMHDLFLRWDGGSGHT